MKYEIVGLRKETYVGECVEGHNCDFDYEPAEMFRHVLLLKDIYGNKSELTLSTTEGECGSGWCTATWGEYEWVDVNTFAGKTHNPIKPLFFETKPEKDLGDCFQCDAFYFSDDGGDSYYPSGCACADISLFTDEGMRSLDKRPVWVFYGSSMLGKSHLAASLRGKTILETDSLENGKLPEVIMEDVVVVGNKYSIDMKELQSKLFGNPKVIEVKFSEVM